MRFFDTMTSSLQEFKPLDAKNIRMYVCGPTVYDSPHIGNARPIVVYDLIFRLLAHKYGKESVTYVRNITDVDDKINKAAKEQNISIQELTKRITDIFHNDIGELNVLSPTIEPKATEHMPEMIQMIQQLLDKNHAYIQNNHVYFDVTSNADYGKLSGRILDELIAGSRIEIEGAKRNPGDFVLWKPAAEGDDESSIFDSPWGRGRPGWHIECSAMSSKYLGVDFDIHGGGADLMFPHHTNEIAQSTCANAGSIFAKYWIHNGFVTVEGEKMSKSLGNFITIRDLLEKHDGEALRLMLLSTHYRKPLDCSEKSVNDAKKMLDGLYRIFEQYPDVKPGLISSELLDALEDDLNTPKAISMFHEKMRQINKKSSDILELVATLKADAEFFGIGQRKVSEWFGVINDDLTKFVEQKIAERNQAKANKNYAQADNLREELLAKGVMLEDRPGGEVSWKLVNK